MFLLHPTDLVQFLRLGWKYYVSRSVCEAGKT